MDREQMLRMHIRKLLLPYALTHLTINYIEHSQSEALKLLSESLDIVSMQDMTFLALPVEPLDALFSLYHVKELPPFMETWKVDTDAKDLLMKTLGNLSTASEVPTASCLNFNEDFLSPEPMWTILTRQAICETPELGKRASDHTKVLSTPSVLSNTIGLKVVREEQIKPTSLSPKDRGSLLGVRYSIDKEIYDSVTHLVNQIAGATRATEDMVIDGNTRPSRAFLRDDSPPFGELQERMSPPIFPVNVSRQLQITGPGKPPDIRSLGFIKKVEFINDEEDIAKEHMRVINGWTIMPEVSSDTPSLGNSSQTTEFDELFALTPPRRPVSPKMDEYLIPRVHHPGGDPGGIKGKDDIHNLSTFISPLLPEMRPIPSSDPIQFNSYRQEVSSSVLGQPPSPLRSCMIGANDLKRDEALAINEHRNQTPERLNVLVETLCASVRDECPEDWILSERLEEKESLMMEVPKMKEPRAHPSVLSCAITLQAPSALVSSKNATDDVNRNSSVGVMKKVSGLQSLNIELSWRPFNFGSRVPTIEELVNTESFLPSTVLELNDDAKDEERVRNFISSAESKEKDSASKNVDPGDDFAMEFTNTFGGDYDIVLTNADRRRIYALYQDKSQEIAILKTPTEHEKFEGPVLTGKPTKRLRTAPPSAVNDFNMEIEPTLSGQDILAAESPPLTLLSPEIDDGYRPLSWDHDVVEEKAINAIDNPLFAECGNISRHKSPVGHKGMNETVARDPILYDISTSVNLPSDMKSVRASRAEQNESHTNSSRKQTLAPARLALADFLHLRARGKLTVHNPEPLLSWAPSPSFEERLIDEDIIPPRREIPPEIIDTNTVSLPSDWACPMTCLRFMASVNVLQKTVLLEYLGSDCRISLVERENAETHGADLILDVDTALLFVPLSSLHLSKEKLAERIAALSWRFGFIMVVFEAFSSATALRPQRLNEGNLTPYAFPPIAIKAIKTLKRLLTVMELMQPQKNEKMTTKSANTIVKYAYAQDVSEAAKFTRLVGDEIGVSDAEWLSDEYMQDEKDLAHIPGMNIYAAAVLLRYIDVSTFVDMSPEERLGQFSIMLGEKRVMILNDEIETRLAILANSSSPVTAAPFLEEVEEDMNDGTTNAPYETEYKGPQHDEDRIGAVWLSSGS